MQFTQPLFGLLAVPAGLFLWWTWGQVHGMARFRKKLAFAVRSLLLAALIIALMGPQAVRVNKGLCTIFLLDRSGSIRDADRRAQIDFVNAAVERMNPDDAAGVMAFGKEPLIEAAPAGKRTFAGVESKIDPSETDIAAAIRLASALFPEGKDRRLVLLSDGNETSGDAREAALVAKTQDIQLDSFVLGKNFKQAEAALLQMDAPNSQHVDEPFHLRIVASSTVAQSAVVQIERDGAPLKRMAVDLSAGQNSIVFQDQIGHTGFHRYRATLVAQEDTDPRNNVGESFVSVRSKPRFLIVQERSGDKTLQDALTKSGMDADLVGPAGIPLNLEEATAYDAIIFNDVNASHMLPAQMTLLQSAVKDAGVGFAMIGGDDSFLSGGYYGTPIADALPIDLNVRQRKEFPSTSVLIVVDASGSMGMVEDGAQKIRLAANAAEQTVKLLGPMDRIGVAGSSDSIDFIAPMQASSDRSRIISQLRKLDVEGGGIFCNMSVKFAKDTLEKENSKVRHYIMLADGNDCDTHEGCVEMVALMAAEHITTSTVAIGDGKDVGFLRQLAAVGGGRFFLADHAGKLPAIMTQDTADIARSAVEEGAFFPKLVGSDPIIDGFDSTPPLLAYNLTDSRPLASTPMVTAKDDPLLAHWRYGLGATLAFTSDAKPKWASKWTPWPGFSAFWSQAIRAVAREAGTGSYQVSLDQKTGKSRVHIRAVDSLGNPLSKVDGKVLVAGPNGSSQEVALTENAPGDFQGSFDSEALGTYIVTITEPDGKGGQRVSSSGFSVAYPPELRTTEPNEALMNEVAAMTGGKVVSGPAEMPLSVARPGVSIEDIWTLFLSICAVLLPLDIGLRRVALPFNEIWARFLETFKRRRRAVVEQEVVVGRLHQAKRRAQRDVTPTEAPSTVVPPSAPSREPAAVAGPKDGLSAGERLLESKRRRSGGEEP